MEIDDAKAALFYHGVMVSSTFSDLQEHRKELIKLINANGFKSVAMEQTTAMTKTVLESSLDMVRNSSAYICIIGKSYGEVVEHPKLNSEHYSLVEIEFRKAQDLGRPILLFLMGKDHPILADDVEIAEDKRKKLQQFIEYAKMQKPDSTIRRVYYEFDNKNDFSVKVTQALGELQRRFNPPSQSVHSSLSSPAVTREEPSDQRSPVESQARDPGGASRVEWVQRYLVDMAPVWRKGGSRAGSRGAGKPFDYRPDQYVELWGTLRLNARTARVARDEKSAKKVDARPLLEWILAPDIPSLFITGPSGAGKTVTMNRASVSAACAVCPRLERQDPEFFSKAVALHLHMNAPTRYPILVSCRRMRDKNAKTDNEWIQIISEALKKDGREHVTADDLEVLFNEPTLLLFDDIDQIENPDVLDNLLRAILSLSSWYPDLKVVIAGRDAGSVSEHDFFTINVLPLYRSEQIDYARDYPRDASRGSLLKKRVGEWHDYISTSEVSGTVLDTPLILNLVCWMLNEGVELPRSRGELCHLLISRLLDPDSGHGTGDNPRRDSASSREGLRRLARRACETGGFVAKAEATKLVSSPDILRDLVALGLIRKITPDRRRTGIEFPHALLREYVTAESLSQEFGPQFDHVVTAACGLGTEQWDSIVSYIPGILLRQDHRQDAARFCRAIVTEANQTDDPVKALRFIRLGIGGEAVLLEIFGNEWPAFVDTVYRAYTKHASSWPLCDREEAFAALTRQSTDRERLLSVKEPWAPIVGEGYGETRLSSFELSAIPVLVADFKKFLAAPDRAANRYWTHARKGAIEFLDDAMPDEWYEQLKWPGRPVVGVTWFEAVAYCHWLAARESRSPGSYRLPTARQWRLAVARLGGSLYPWGEEPPKPGNGANVNWRMAALTGPSTCGLFAPIGNGPKVFDFGSNVIEWGAPPKTELVVWPLDPSLAESAEGLGGGWQSRARECEIDRAALTPPPNRRVLYYGFRLIRIQDDRGRQISAKASG